MLDSGTGVPHRASSPLGTIHRHTPSITNAAAAAAVTVAAANANALPMNAFGFGAPAGGTP